MNARQLLELLECDRSGCECHQSRRLGRGLTHCPVHDSHTNGDDDPSLSVWTDDDGDLAYACKTGCEWRDVMPAVVNASRNGSAHKNGSTALVKGSRAELEPAPPDVTLSSLAEWCRLDVEALTTAGCRELRWGGGRAVAIPYYDRNGKLVREHVRVRLGKPGSRFNWTRGDGHLLYGLWYWSDELLPLVHEHGFLLLVEGESSTWSAWESRLPALGIPGAEMWDKVRASLPRLPRGTALVLVRDQDKGGEHLADTIAADVRELLTIAPDGDLNDLWKDGGEERVREVVLAMVEQARAGTELAVPGASWLPVDLGAVLDGDAELTAPELLTRGDGLGLLYKGRVHDVHAEQESGKTWLALVAVVEALRTGRAWYIDFDDNPTGIVGRLRALGVRDAVMRERFTYSHPEDPPDVPAILASLRELAPDLVVIDGLNDAMASAGKNSDSGPDVADWKREFLAPLRRCGATFLFLDHVVKDRDNRGKWAAGSQHKANLIDGAAFVLEMVQTFGRGKTGRAVLRIDKDRNGYLRGREVDGRRIAEFELTANQAGDTVTYKLTPPAPGEAAHDDKARRDYLKWRVCKFLAPLPFTKDAPEWRTTNAIDRGVRGKAADKRRVLLELRQDGYLESEAGPNKSIRYRFVKPYPPPHGVEDEEQDDDAAQQ